MEYPCLVAFFRNTIWLLNLPKAAIFLTKANFEISLFQLTLKEIRKNMQIFPPTVILRHQRENLKKCSLRGLETRDDFIFVTYPTGQLPSLENYILFTVDAPPLTKEDTESGFFFIDATWRLAAKMENFVLKEHTFKRRSLPVDIKTSYPRRNTDCPDPERGLATVEAIVIAYHLAGRSIEGLLDNYHWKDDFLASLNLNETI